MYSALNTLVSLCIKALKIMDKVSTLESKTEGACILPITVTRYSNLKTEHMKKPIHHSLKIYLEIINSFEEQKKVEFLGDYGL